MALARDHPLGQPLQLSASCLTRSTPWSLRPLDGARVRTWVDDRRGHRSRADAA